MSIPNRSDIVVIGGGPAGSTAATLLAQKGYDVVLIEKEKHPRFAVGESLIPHFWKYADLSGVAEKIEAEGFIQKAGGTVIWNDTIRQMRFSDFGYQRPALHVERDRFDQILLDHARDSGVQVFEQTAVTATTLGGDAGSRVGFRSTVDDSGTGEIACQFIVDASGQSAVLARQLGIREMDEGFQFMSLWGYFRNSKYVAADGRAYAFDQLHSNPPTTLVSNVGQWGWSWHIPMRESTSVGFVLPRDDIRNYRGIPELKSMFLERCASVPVLNQLLEEAEYIDDSFHVIRDYSYKPAKLAGPGYFLVGDAAAFVDPVFSIGVVLAMYSAFLAAWAIDRSLANPARADSSHGIYAKQLGTRLEASRALALPRYGLGNENTEMVAYSLQFETSLEQELMYVVSTLTTRSENFSEMSQDQEKPVSSNKYRILESIQFN